VTGAIFASKVARSAADSTWSLMKNVPVSSLENCCDSVILPLASTMAPL